MLATFLSLLLVTSLQAHERDPEEGEFFEGDMILTPAQRDMLGSSSQMKRGAVIGKRWPNGVIPYEVHSSLPSQAETVIFGAMKEWADNTCLKFKQRTNEQKFIQFVKPSAIGCASFVGYQGRIQQIWLSSACWNHGVVLHEIGHALGFYHEHSRPDRDKYVKIHWDNVQTDKRGNFNKLSTSVINSLGQPYDYGSIMHYRKTAFSKDGSDTITPLYSGVTIGQRVKLSAGDIKQMNLMYKCSDLNCPTGWHHYNGDCYLFSTYKLSWTSALVKCISLSARLLCVMNTNEWAFVKSKMSRWSRRKWWVGVNDLVSEGSYQCDGESLTFTHWANNEPKSSQKRDCTRVEKKPWKWTIRSCKAKLYFICKL